MTGTNQVRAPRRRAWVWLLLWSGILALGGGCLAAAAAPPGAPVRALPMETPFPTNTPPPTLPPLIYPPRRAPLTDLNPVYAPFLLTDPHWRPHVVTSHDPVPGGNRDYVLGCATPTAVCPWTTLTATTGLVTRLYMGQAVAPFGDDIQHVRIMLYSPATALTPTAVISVNALVTATTYPLAANGKYSSGVVVTYQPFVFTGSLRLASVGATYTYFQVNYLASDRPLTATGWLTRTGWVSVTALAQLWQPDAMGQPVDALSYATPVFTGVTALRVTTTLAPAATATVFTAPGAGTIVQLTWPAAALARPAAYPAGARSPFQDLWLRVYYGDPHYLSTTFPLSVNLPLELVLLAPEADYTPDQPPTTTLDALVMTPGSQLAIVQGETVWVLEPPAYDHFFHAQGAVTTSVGAEWYRMSLDRWLSSGVLTTTPPITAVTAYSLHALRTVTGTIVAQAETVVQGANVFTRTVSADPWMTGTLAQAWISDTNHPPTDTIYGQAFDFDADSSRSTLTQTVIDWHQGISGTAWTCAVPPQGPISWQSFSLVDLLYPLYTPAYTMSVDAYAETPLGRIFVSGDRYWFCPVGQDQYCQANGWSSGSLQEAWWLDDRVYGPGNLFFGRDERGTPHDPTDDRYYLTLPMPYQDGITVTLFNAATCADCAVTLTTVIAHTPQVYGPGSGYLTIQHHQAVLSATAATGVTLLPGWPNEVAAVTLVGRGKLVGVVRAVRGAIEYDYGRTFLEGDELILPDYVTGTVECDTPWRYVGCGTSHEEFSNAGWYFLNGPFYLPLAGVPLSPPNVLQLPPPNPTLTPTPRPTLSPTAGPSPLPTPTPQPTPYGAVYRGELNRYEGADWENTATIMYRFFLNDAVPFQHRLLVASELAIAPAAEVFADPPPPLVPGRRGQPAGTGRRDLTTIARLVVIAYVQPPQVFLPVVLRSGNISETLALPERPGAGYPPPERPAPPGGDYPPPLLGAHRPAPPAGRPWGGGLVAVAVGGLAAGTAWAGRRLGRWRRPRRAGPPPTVRPLRRAGD